MINLRRSAVLMMVATGVGTALSFGKEMVVAWRFGLERGMDAYYAALTIPGALSSMVGFSAMAVLLPAYVRIKNSDAALASGMARKVLLDVPIFLAALALFVGVFSKPLIHLCFPGLSPEASSLAADLQRLTAAAGIFTGAAALLSGLLNAEGKLVAPALSGSIVTLSTIVAILLFAGRWGVASLAVGLLAGAAIQTFVLKSSLDRIVVRAPRPSWNSPEMKGMIPLLGTLLGTYGMAEMYTLIDRWMASTLPVGSIAALGYSLKLYAVPQAILCTPIIAASYPLLAERDARGETEALEEDFRKATRLGYATLLPATCFLALFAEPIVQVLFQRGRFDAAATHLAAATLAGFCLQLPWSVPSFLAVRLVMIRRAGKTLVAVTGAGVAMNVAANWALMRLWNPPVAGIAVSTSAVSFMCLVFYSAALRRDYPWLGISRILRECRDFVLPTVAMLAASELTWRLAPLCGLDRPLFRLGGTFLVGAATLAATAHLFGLEEMIRGLDLTRAWLSASREEA